MPRTTPSGSPAAPGAQPASPPPREVPLVEKKWETLANTDVSEAGKIALGIAPEKWKHAETDNFILHYRRVTEAQKVAREVEYDLWFVATTLGATKDRYTRKSHVYVFEDDDEWKEYLSKTEAPSWAASFAKGDELFLNVRRAADTGRFNSSTLPHETTHAVVARLFPGKRWPLWLSEGFAEYMGGASIAARKGQTVKRYQANLSMAEMPLTTMESLRQYPPDEESVAQLYQTSEKFVRFLMNEPPKGPHRAVHRRDPRGQADAGGGARGVCRQVQGLVGLHEEIRALHEVMPAAKSKAATAAQVHAVLGSDDAEVKRAARDLAVQLTPAAGGDFGCDIIDGAVQLADDAATRIHSAIEALLTFPFFGGEKLVWLKSATFLADDQLGRSQAVLEALEKLAATLQGGVPESTRFLLSAVGVDKRRSFYKTLTKLAKVTVLDKLDTSKSGWEEAAAAMVRELAGERGLTLSSEAEELFVMFTGGERRVVESELEKLDLYLGAARRSGTGDDVRLVVPVSREGSVFELGNAIAERNRRRALALLDQLLFQGESAIGIMYARHSHGAQSPARPGPHEAPPAQPPGAAVLLWQDAREAARGSHRAPATQKGRHAQRLPARSRCRARAPLPGGRIARGARRLPRGKHPARDFGPGAAGGAEPVAGEGDRPTVRRNAGL